VLPVSGLLRAGPMITVARRQIFRTLPKIALILALAVTGGPAAAGSGSVSKLDSALQKWRLHGSSGDRARVIIRVKRGQRGERSTG
jgi:hypothetical protein